MKMLGVKVVSLVGVPGIVFGIAYGMGCSNDANDPAMNGEAVQGKICPVDDNPCIVTDCSKGTLETRELDAGTPVGEGKSECFRKVCQNVAGVMKPVDKPRTLDEPCSVGVCDGQGQCVNACGDGRQNGDEDGLDCGGSHCKRCNGQDCGVNKSPCLSGNCVDGVCCDKPCAGVCESCGTGTCTLVPFNTESTACIWPNACDGIGNCKIATGAPCDGKKNTDCVGVKCRGKCGLNQVCYNSNSCGSNACVGSICLNGFGLPCSNSSDCDSNMCNVATNICE